MMADMADIDWAFVLDRGTAFAWFVLALVGILLRVRRLGRLNQIILPKPEEPEDVKYLRSVKRSTYLRLATKVVLLIGATIALFQLFDFYLVWRGSVILILVLMIAETRSVDLIRAYLARNAALRKQAERP